MVSEMKTPPKFAVFGLGNRVYKHFCGFAKLVSKE